MSYGNRFTDALVAQKQKTEIRNPLIAGTLGIASGGSTIVEVPNRASYVYVQIRSSQAEVIQAFNSTVSPVYGLPVMIQWQGNRYVVVERDTLRYSNWIDSTAYLPRHASTHEFSGSAGDVVFVSQQQFLPLLPTPSGSVGNGSIVVNDYNLQMTGGNFTYFPAQATQNLTVWNPLSPTGAVMVLVTLDASNGNLSYVVGSGTVFGNWLTGTADVLPNVPAVPDLNRYIPVAAIRLVTGTFAITWDNIYDVRPLFGVTRGVGGGGGGGAGAGGGMLSGSAPIWLNNGVFVATGTQINLLGSNFTLTHSGTEIDLTILGGGGGGTGFLSLDTSNGPLFGPLVVYQKFPNSINQYFDFSTVVAFMSGTATAQFGASVEAVQWSTGSQTYGIYIDDEAAGSPSLYIGDQGRMDKITFNIDQFIGQNWNVLPRYLSSTVQWNRHGNNKTQYKGAFLQMNHVDPTHDYGPSIEIDANFVQIMTLWPHHTGSLFYNNYPFSFEDAPYWYDTYRTLPTGTTLAIWNHATETQAWLTPRGDLAINQLRIREYDPGRFTTDHKTGSFSQGSVSLVNGTASIPTTAVTMSSRIYLTTQFGSGTHVGFNYVYSRAAGSGFTIRSSDLQDTSLVAWLLVEPS